VILNVFNTNIKLEECLLSMEEKNLTNIFAKKNNKTLCETVYNDNPKNKYKKFKQIVDLRYSKYKDFPLGEFLSWLKSSNDFFYKDFLNKYGDGNFCKFTLVDKHLTAQKGIYCYCIDGGLVYIGRCLDSFQKRVNQGYGNIHPKNCYIDGQQTNCRINSLINSERGKLSFHIHPMLDNSQIKDLEKHLIRKYNPIWNTALRI